MPKWYTKEDALRQLQRYCAYQDRCHQEVRQKLRDMGVYPDWQDEIILELLEDNFLNEERFARSFARGKFRIKGWGRRRIQRELKQRDISEYCIRKAMEEIPAEAYEATLRQLVEKKLSGLKEPNIWKRKQKAANFALQRGFEPQLAWSIVHELTGNNN